MNKRQKISQFLILASFLLSAIVYLISEDQILTEYSIVNGVKSISYMPKFIGTVSMTVIQIILAFLWNTVANWNDKKIQSNPQLTSLRFRGTLINFYFFTLSLVVPIVGIINIVLWLQSLL